MKSVFVRVRPHSLGWILQRGNRALSIHRTFEQALAACLRMTRFNAAEVTIERASVKG